MKRKVLFVLALVPLCLFGANAFLIGDMLPDAPALAPRGEYSVGVRTIAAVNPDQLNILAYQPDNPNPRYDRELVLEVWYPAALEDHQREGTYYIDHYYRHEPIVHQGRATRDAKPLEGRFPLIVVSHGYPGTRNMMSFLTENLASKGYVVVTIDHTESTVLDQSAFSSTLLNRPLDILFVIDEMERLAAQEDHFLYGKIDAQNVGLVGYSMGGYGIINAAGAGISQAGVNLSWGVPGGHLAIRQSGNPVFEESLDSRIKAIFALAPWGASMFWDPDTMKGLTVPSFFVVGDQDDVSGYQQGVKLFYDRAIHSDRYMLVFENARHNVGVNAYGTHPLLSIHMTADDYLRYAEPAWDLRRLNNIVQHFATAFFDQNLKGIDTHRYLDLVEYSNQGVWSQERDGTFKADHTHWEGFPNRTALGMRLYFMPAE